MTRRGLPRGDAVSQCHQCLQVRTVSQRWLMTERKTSLRTELTSSRGWKVEVGPETLRDRCTWSIMQNRVVFVTLARGEILTTWAWEWLPHKEGLGEGGREAVTAYPGCEEKQSQSGRPAGPGSLSSLGTCLTPKETVIQSIKRRFSE